MKGHADLSIYSFDMPDIVIMARIGVIENKISFLKKVSYIFKCPIK